MKAVPLNRYIIFFAIAILGCLADLSTKSWVFAELGSPPSPTLWLWDNVAGLQTSLNEGALFGMGQGKVVFFAVLSILAFAGIIIWLFPFAAAKDRLLTIALGCVAAGILGNLYDRLGSVDQRSLHGRKRLRRTDAIRRRGDVLDLPHRHCRPAIRAGNER